MVYVTQPQGAPVAQEQSGQAQTGTNPQGQPTMQTQPQANQTESVYQTQPQPGGFYQFQPGVGFVQVQGASTQSMPNANSVNTQSTSGPTIGTAEASAQAAMSGQGMPEGTQPQFDQKKLGEVYGMVNDVMNGDAEPTQLLSLFAGTGSDFWKGALVGAAAAVLLNNETVKGAVTGAFGSMFGDKDPEGPQVTVGDK